MGFYDLSKEHRVQKVAEYRLFTLITKRSTCLSRETLVIKKSPD